MSSIFSKILSGKIPGYKIHEDQWTFAILTKDAIQIGHTLVIPKVEVDHFLDVPDVYWSKVLENGRLIGRALQKVTGCGRVGVMIAGWEIPHFHLHVVPMFHPFDLDLSRGRERSREENLKMQAALSAQLKGPFSPRA